MKKTILNQKEVDDIIKMYLEDCMGSDAIFKKTGIGKKIVLNTLKENNITNVLKNILFIMT
jgi:hypothetical protein